MKKILALLFIVFTQLVQAAISVEVNPPKISLGETFSLVLSAESNQPREEMPDLSVLQKDFTIMGTGRSLNFSFINGQSRSISRWSIVLSPNKPGKLTIPPIQIGNEKSTPATIEVTGEPVKVEPSTQSAAENDVILKTEATPPDVFVNQEILYTVKVYNRQNLIDVIYQPPKVENALMLSLGEGKRYQTVENGETYIVEEERYAVFPQKSGNFEIIPPQFNALIYDFTPRKVHVEGKPLKINVKSIPAPFNGKNWFPAKKVNLSEEYNETRTNFLQGSTLVRNITIQALGVPGELLPNLNLGNSSEFKIYPEKPEAQTTSDQNELTGTTKIKITYLFNKSGDITIPELRVPWFNTNTGKEEMAVLPARILHIDAKGANSNIPQNQPPAVVRETNKESKPLKEPQLSPTKVSNYLPWIIAGLFALAWILTIVLWLYWRRPELSPGKRQILKQLHEACINNNPLAAQNALLEWAKIEWPTVRVLTLNDISRQIADPTFKKEIQFLSETLYSPDKKRLWKGQGLWQCVSKYRKRKKSKAVKKDLPPINP